MANFSKRHLEVIARLLCNSNASTKVVYTFADAMEQDNPRFKRALFMKATKACKR